MEEALPLFLLFDGAKNFFVLPCSLFVEITHPETLIFFSQSNVNGIYDKLLSIAKILKGRFSQI